MSQGSSVKLAYDILKHNVASINATDDMCGKLLIEWKVYILSIYMTYHIPKK